jgi:hypothetical protein
MGPPSIQPLPYTAIVVGALWICLDGLSTNAIGFVNNSKQAGQ